MRQRTIFRSLQSEDEISPERYRIYLIRAGETALYIGQASNTHDRMLTHLGIGGFSGAQSLLGECIHAHDPASGEWMFEEYTLEDCREIIHDSSVPLDVDEMEIAMIKHHHPCLNVAANPHPTPLPSSLEWRLRRIEDTSSVSRMLDYMGIE